MPAGRQGVVEEEEEWIRHTYTYTSCVLYTARSSVEETRRDRERERERGGEPEIDRRVG